MPRHIICNMLFNSFEFIIFLPIVFVLYWFVFKQRICQNLLIVVASYIFYGWWNWKFLLLIALTSICSFVSGIVLERNEKSRNVQKWISASNIVLNLAILGVFKYYDFFVENLQSALGHIGWKLDFVTLNLVLPVGISFYTFQALSYTIDVYRSKIKATHDPIEFFAFISFFPQLVAGPIERATDLLPQFQCNRTFDYPKAVDGCRQMLWGFFKKLVVADTCAGVVNRYWDSYCTLPGFSLFLLGVFFSMQIYCDFSGYSDIAIGCARLFGLNLKRNFDVPYFSRSIPEFWRRWHISLTTWFRDYIYFPLGGSRCGKAKTIRNVFIVWGISGLWHGANWTFVCWGLFHASLLVIYNILGVKTKCGNVVAYNRLFPNAKELLQMSLTFVLAVLGWIIFRSENMTQAMDYFHRMLGNEFFRLSMFFEKKKLCLCVGMLILEWIQRNKQHAFQLEEVWILQYRVVRWMVYYFILASIVYSSESSQTFIYFQF